jgi:hypothetical protein
LVVTGYGLARLVAAAIFGCRTLDAQAVLDVARSGIGLVSTVADRLAADALVRAGVANRRSRFLAVGIFGALHTLTVEATGEFTSASLVVWALDADVFVLQVLIGRWCVGGARRQVGNSRIVGSGYCRRAEWIGRRTTVIRAQDARGAVFLNALGSAAAAAVFRELAMRRLGARHATRAGFIFDANRRRSGTMAGIFSRTRLALVSTARRGFGRGRAVEVDFTRYAGRSAFD